MNLTRSLNNRNGSKSRALSLSGALVCWLAFGCSSTSSAPSTEGASGSSGTAGTSGGIEDPEMACRVSGNFSGASSLPEAFDYRSKPLGSSGCALTKANGAPMRIDVVTPVADQPGSEYKTLTVSVFVGWDGSFEKANQPVQAIVRLTHAAPPQYASHVSEWRTADVDDSAPTCILSPTRFEKSVRPSDNKTHFVVEGSLSCPAPAKPSKFDPTVSSDTTNEATGELTITNLAFAMDYVGS